MVRTDDVLSEVERALKGAHATRLQVDLTEVAALDSSGVALLILLRRLAHRVDVAFAVGGERPEVRHHLDMAGLTGLLGLRPVTDSEAVGTVAAGEVVDVPSLDERFDRGSLVAVRERLLTYAASCGLAGMDQYRLLLAVTEMMTNAVFHGGGRGTLTAERRGNRLILRIIDQGSGIPRQYRTERPRPRAGRIGSAGLWMARRICERVDIDTGPGGTTVQLTYPLPAHPDE